MFSYERSGQRQGSPEFTGWPTVERVSDVRRGKSLKNLWSVASLPFVGPRVARSARRRRISSEQLLRYRSVTRSVADVKELSCPWKTLPRSGLTSVSAS